MAVGADVSRGKIFSEFFTNLAVATLSAGILIPLFAQVAIPLNLLILSLSGSGFSMLGAIMIRNLK